MFKSQQKVRSHPLDENTFLDVTIPRHVPPVVLKWRFESCKANEVESYQQDDDEQGDDQEGDQQGDDQLTTACCSSFPSSSSSPRTWGSPKRFSAARFSLSSSSSSAFFSFSKLLSKISFESKFSSFAAALLLFFPFLQNQIGHSSSFGNVQIDIDFGRWKEKFGEWRGGVINGGDHKSPEPSLGDAIVGSHIGTASK